MENKRINRPAAARYCPRCRQRLLDNVKKGDARVIILCPRCRQRVEINLAYRMAR